MSALERETWGSTLNRSYRIKNRSPIIGHGVCCVALRGLCCLAPLFVTDQLVASCRARHAAASWAELRSISERPTTPPSLRRLMQPTTPRSPRQLVPLPTPPEPPRLFPVVEKISTAKLMASMPDPVARLPFPVSRISTRPTTSSYALRHDGIPGSPMTFIPS